MQIHVYLRVVRSRSQAVGAACSAVDAIVLGDQKMLLCGEAARTPCQTNQAMGFAF